MVLCGSGSQVTRCRDPIASHTRIREGPERCVVVPILAWRAQGIGGAGKRVPSQSKMTAWARRRLFSWQCASQPSAAVKTREVTDTPRSVRLCSRKSSCRRSSGPSPVL